MISILLFSIVQVLPGDLGLVGNAAGEESWVQSTRSDFNSGKISNVMVQSNGTVSLAFEDSFVKDRYADGQTLVIDFNKTYGGKSYERLKAISRTNDGGYILGGWTYSYGVEPKSSIPKINGWLVKTDSEGNAEWSKAHGYIYYDFIEDVKQTKDGGYIATGQSSGGFWILRLNSTGDFLWQRYLNSGIGSSGYSVLETGNGDFIATGYVQYQRWSRPDLVLAKVSKTNSLMWTKVFGGDLTDYGMEVRQLDDDDLIVAGYTNSYGKGGYDVWLINTDSNGNAKWKKTYGGGYDDQGYSVKQTKDKGLVIAGYTCNGSSSDPNILLLKTNRTGVEQWNSTFGGSDPEMGYSVQQTSEGGYIIAGTIYTEKYRYYDAFIIKTDPSGKEKWNKNFGTKSYNRGYAILESKNGSYVLGGTRYASMVLEEFWLYKISEPSRKIIDNGDFASRDLLSDVETHSVKSINCSASIPSGTKIKIRFSSDNVSWYNNLGEQGKYNNIDNGTNTLSLSGFDDGISEFYYKLNFTSNNRTESVILNFNLTVRQYRPNGMIESAPFDSRCFTIWNSLNWDANEPDGTSIVLQLRSGANKTDLEKGEFVGFDGKQTSYYNISGMKIWKGHDFHRWLQYKVYLGTEKKDTTPLLNEVTIRYESQSGIPLLISPFDGQVTNSSKPNFKWTFLGSDYKQSGFQVLIDNDLTFTSIDYDSRMQNSTYHTWQFPHGTDYDKISDGQWFWKVRIKNDSGNWTPFLKISKFSVDTVKPVSKITNLNDDVIYNSLKEVKGTSIDPSPGSGVSRVEVEIKRLNDNKTWNGSTWTTGQNWLKATGTAHWYYQANPWLENMKYSIRSRAVDNSSNIEPVKKPHVFTFKRDGIKPTSTITSKMGITGTASDTGGSGIDYVEVCINAFFDVDPYWDGNGWSYTDIPIWLRASGTTNWSYKGVWWRSLYGSYTVYSRAVDKAGNVQSPTTTVWFCIDSDGPEININNVASGLWYTNIGALTGYANDESFCSGVVRKIEGKISVYGYTGSSIINISGGYPQAGLYYAVGMTNIKWPSNLESTMTVESIATGIDGDSTTASIKVGFDTKPPISKVVFPSNNSVFKDLNEIKGTAHDGGSGVNFGQVFIKNLTDNTYWNHYYEKWSPWITGWNWKLNQSNYQNNDINWTFDTSKIDWKSGKYLISSQGFDRAFKNNVNYAAIPDNNAEVPGYGTVFTIDNEPPSLSLMINKGNLYFNNTNVDLAISGNDSFSEIKQMAFSTDNKTWSAWENYSSDKNFNFPPADGKRTIYCKIKDDADNFAYASSTIIIDTVPPKLWLTTGGLGAWSSNSRPLLTMPTTDSRSGIDRIEVRVDSGNFTVQKSPYKVPELSDGVHNITVRSYDRAGNFVEKYVDVFIDTRAPGNLSIIINDDLNKTNSTSIDLSLNAFDVHSGVASMSFSFDNEHWIAWENFNTTISYQLPEDDGEKSVYFRVKDSAGNIAGPVFDSIILNTTVPDTDYPADDDSNMTDPGDDDQNNTDIDDDEPPADPDDEDNKPDNNITGPDIERDQYQKNVDMDIIDYNGDDGGNAGSTEDDGTEPIREEDPDVDETDQSIEPAPSAPNIVEIQLDILGGSENRDGKNGDGIALDPSFDDALSSDDLSLAPAGGNDPEPATTDDGIAANVVRYAFKLNYGGAVVIILLLMFSIYWFHYSTKLREEIALSIPVEVKAMKIRRAKKLRKLRHR